MIISDLKGVPAIDLTQIEKMKKWLELEPKAGSGFYLNEERNSLINSIQLDDINSLYRTIEFIDGEVDINNKAYRPKNVYVDEQICQLYESLIERIPSFDIDYFAKLKFSFIQLSYCNLLANQDAIKNSKDMAVFTLVCQDRFMREYMLYLFEKNHMKVNQDFEKTVETGNGKQRKLSIFLKKWRR